MGLGAAISIGQSALSVSQRALQVTGNNLANAATPGYSRQAIALSPVRGSRDGSLEFGRGVSIIDVQRQVSNALLERLRGSISDQALATERLNVYSQLEATLNELGDQDLSSELNRFFNAWSERANLTSGSATVIQQGRQLAGFIQQVDADLRRQQQQVDKEIDAVAGAADQLVRDIADLNRQIVTAEVGSASANALRDQRDIKLEQLAEYLDIASVEQPDGAVDVLVGSTPVVLGATARGLRAKSETIDGRLAVSLVTGDNARPIDPGAGRLGGLIEARQGAIQETMIKLDELAGQLAFEVNRRHATATNAGGLTSATGTIPISLADRSVALSSPQNSSLGELHGPIRNGGFFVRIENQQTGAIERVRVDIDLDGLDATGAESFDGDTTLEDIVSSIDGARGISASLSPDGRLQVRAASGYSFSFEDDSSGALAALGVNAFFTGNSARDLQVRDELLSDSSKLLVGRYDGDSFIENGSALSIASLQDQAIAGLQGRSFGEAWQDRVQAVAVETQGALSRTQAAGLVRQSLEAQRGSISGVSIDEESVNLLNYQRQYEAAARLITVANELLDTLISLA